MKPRKERKEKRDTRVELLRQLASWNTEDGPLNKYRLEKKLKTRRETLYNLIDEFKERELIRVVKRVPTQAGDMSEQYTITDRGLYSAAMLNPDLEREIASKLGGKFREMKENVTRHRVESFERWAKMARTIIVSGKAVPNSSMRMEIRADEKGHVRGAEVWIKPWGDRVARSRELEKLRLAAKKTA
jgi:hypothetical protein